MEYLQYSKGRRVRLSGGDRFKPYYKWNTFNTLVREDQSFNLSSKF